MCLREIIAWSETMLKTNRFAPPRINCLYSLLNSLTSRVSKYHSRIAQTQIIYIYMC